MKPCRHSDQRVRFDDCIPTSLPHAVDRILDSDYYEAHAEALESYFVIYKQKVEQYAPASRLANMWAIYQRPNYR